MTVLLFLLLLSLFCHERFNIVFVKIIINNRGYTNHGKTESATHLVQIADPNLTWMVHRLIQDLAELLDEIIEFVMRCS